MKNETGCPCFDEDRYETEKSSIAFVMGHLGLRHLNMLYQAFDGDLLLPIVLGEIAHHNVARFFSSSGACTSLRDQLVTAKRRGPHLEPTNAYSLSQATGIPRETLRRKIDKLVKKGWLIKSGRGDVTISETVADHFMGDFNKNLLAELLDTSECLKKLLEPAKKNEQPSGRFDHGLS